MKLMLNNLSRARLALLTALYPTPKPKLVVLQAGIEHLDLAQVLPKIYWRRLLIEQLLICTDRAAEYDESLEYLTWPVSELVAYTAQQLATHQIMPSMHYESRKPTEPTYRIFDITEEPYASGTCFTWSISFWVHPYDANFGRFLQHTYEDYSLPFQLGYDQATQVFSVTEAVTYTKTTLGALAELRDLANGVVDPRYRFIPTSYLYHCVETLLNYWD